MGVVQFLWQFLYSQLLVTPPYPTKDFTGQTVIVTGSNTGLGLEAARHFVRLNCQKLIIGVRSVSKGQAAKESILTSTKRTDDCIEVWELDLSSSASVKAFAKRAEALERLDVVVENAGVSFHKYTGGAEGHELTIQTNVLATLLLALLLLPKLRETEEKHQSNTHLEIVTSEGHHFAKFPERNAEDIYAALDSEKDYLVMDRYFVSKLLEVLFVRELVKHTAESPVLTLVNPGFCHSELTRNLPSFFEVVMGLFKQILARTTEVGSRTLLAGATAGSASHGEYMSDSENRAVEQWIYTDHGTEVQRKVYEQTLKVLEGVQPGISRNI